MRTDVFAIFVALLVAIKCRADTTAPVGVVVPSSVMAGNPVTATISALEYSATGDTSAIRGMQVFLALGNSTKTPDPKFTISECYLTSLLPLCGVPGVTIYPDHVSFSNYTFVFNVPNTVGQPLFPYALRPQILFADGTYYGPGLLSNSFNLTGVTTLRELFPEIVGSAPYFPCSAYNCALNCALESWGSSNSSFFVKCANKCPDVSVPSDFVNTMSVGPSTSISGTGCVVQAPSSTGAAPTTTASTAVTQTTSSPTKSASATSNNAMPRFSSESGSFSAVLSSLALLLMGLLP